MGPADDETLSAGGLLSDEQFSRVARLAMDRFGLDLPVRKRQMVTNRLTRLRRDMQLESLESLIGVLEQSDSGEDRLQLFDVLSTNLTHFLREHEHLETLLRELDQAPWDRLRIWSAGCSAGCEPYSISMVLAEHYENLARKDFKLLATDFSVSVLRQAKEGLYSQEMVRNLSPEQLTRFMEPQGEEFRVREVLRRPITFALLNLMEPWRMQGPFDAIFCRNVMIYFDKPTREQLTRRFTELLKPGGLLFLGSSESLSGNHRELLRIAPSSYRRSCS